MPKESTKGWKSKKKKGGSLPPEGYKKPTKHGFKGSQRAIDRERDRIVGLTIRPAPSKAFIFRSKLRRKKAERRWPISLKKSH